MVPEEERPVGPSLTRQPVEDPAPVNPSPTSPPAEETGPLDYGVIHWPLEGQLPEQADVPRVERFAAETATTEIESPLAQPQPEAVSRAPERLGTDELNPTRAEAAVRAYCRVLCVPAESEQAVRETLAALAALEEAGGSSSVGEELLSITRAIAVGHASAGAGPPGRRDASSSDEREARCDATPLRLAARANDELDPHERSTLEEHLDGCPLCQATALRIGRAERAFVALVAAVEPEPPSEAAESRTETVDPAV